MRPAHHQCYGFSVRSRVPGGTGRGGSEGLWKPARPCRPDGPSHQWLVPGWSTPPRLCIRGSLGVTPPRGPHSGERECPSPCVLLIGVSGLPGSDPLLSRPSTRRTELVGSGQVDAYRSVRPSLVRGGRREVSVEGVSMDSLKPQPRETVPVPPSRRIPRGP